MSEQKVVVAVEGCGHGTLNAIYAAVERHAKEQGEDGVDLLIIGGDFQAVRNAADLTVMAVPAKYREMGDFHEYYSGARKAPYLTIFVGGNHEASSHLWELFYGGWVAPNIYYMGAANVLRFGPLRIAGMSGIWKGFDYRKPHHERLPFSGDDIKSFYHVRELDIRKLLQLRTQVDIGISHDWPRAIERHGDANKLWRMKPDFRQESIDGTLGNLAAANAMDRLRPAYWFSAHMHCKFAAVKTYDPPKATTTEPSDNSAPDTHKDVREEAIPVESATDAKVANPEEIDLDLDHDEPPTNSTPDPTTTQPTGGDDTAEDLRSLLPASFSKPTLPLRPPTQPKEIAVPEGITNTTTRFLALSKCLPGHKFLQLLPIQPLDSTNFDRYPSITRESPSPGSPRYKLQYDPEWLAITRVFHKHLVIGDRTAQTPPDLGEEHYRPLIEEEEKWVDENITQKGKLGVPDNFAITAPIHNPGDPESTDDQPEEYTNPQTAQFCELIGVTNLWDATEEERAERKARGPPPSEFRGGHHGGRRGGYRGGGHRGGGGYRGGGRGRGRGGGGRGGRGRGRGW
ncbi:putative lariat debranching enzyme protein [Diplogelasinospora grovesii]|uniref:Lariat debranching enzyme protein n=1 Tax=Diplogelasinospora grovesii TaxID=303347 RepID=A0AAN6NAL8_9PEZI|nr:putative lariat debranching enzyme protein [Diplogelasinospora grovesii]